MKTCKGCQQELPLDSFYANKGCRDGRLSWCKKCTYERYSPGMKARRDQLLALIHQIKLEQGCADCGYNAHAAALDFDHLPGHMKEARIAQLSNGARMARIEAEIAKCEVVCANCHRIRTAERRATANV